MNIMSSTKLITVLILVFVCVAMTTARPGGRKGGRGGRGQKQRGRFLFGLACKIENKTSGDVIERTCGCGMDAGSTNCSWSSLTLTGPAQEELVLDFCDESEKLGTPDLVKAACKVMNSSNSVIIERNCSRPGVQPAVGCTGPSMTIFRAPEGSLTLTFCPPPTKVPTSRPITAPIDVSQTCVPREEDDSLSVESEESKRSEGSSDSEGSIDSEEGSSESEVKGRGRGGRGGSKKRSG